MLGDGISPPHNEEDLEPRRPDQKKERKNTLNFVQFVVRDL